MFGIGPTELIVLLVLALIVVGPERLPQMAGQIGKAIRDFRQMSGDVTGEFQRAFQLDEPEPRPAAQVMTDEVIAPTATPNGAAEAVPELSAQVIPSDSPIEPTAVIEEGATATDTANFIPATPPMATKEEPLAGVSFLDEPEPAPAPATTSYDSLNVASFSMPPIEEPVIAANEEPVIAANPVADAWDAVMNTDATISLPEPSAAELQVASVGTAVALAEPEADREEDTATGPVFTEPERRPRTDPTAEVTIREIIEGQVAAEAFRERRRIAKYQRHK